MTPSQEETPQPLLRQFYDTLVGNEQRIQALGERLTSRLLAPIASHEDPYSRLQEELDHEICEAASELSLQDDPDLSHAQSIQRNGEFGVRIAKAALQTMGDLYAKHATIPQNVGTVTESTDSAMWHVFKMACSARLIAGINLAVGITGVPPSNLLGQPHQILPIIKSIDETITFNPDMFKVTDMAGQLAIRPRYPLLNNGSIHKGRLCPGAKTKTRVAGIRQPSLFVLLKAMGDATVRAIYPRYFAITLAKHSETE